METKANPGPNSCYAKALPDEPMFILLARDPAAPKTIIRWVKQRRRSSTGNEEGQIEGAFEDAEIFKRWRDENMGKWRDHQPAVPPDLIPTPSDQIASIAGKALGGKQLTKAEGKSLAAFVMRSDRHPGPGNQEKEA